MKKDKKNIEEEINKCKNDPYYFYVNYTECPGIKLTREDFESIYNSIVPNENGKVIITSTPKGENFYYDVYLKNYDGRRDN